MPEATIFNDDCLSTLKRLPDNSIDSLVTDPPCGIAFMGKEWDSDRGGRDQWCAWMSEIMRECLRVLKPGGHGLVWALPKTSHWTGVALEDAGFEVRDIFTHLFGTGFPKSSNIGKAIDKKFGMEREVVGEQNYSAPDIRNNSYDQPDVTGSRDRLKINITTPASDEAKQWEGWGSALKPSCEFWFLIRKPLSEKTIVDNVLKHGTGGLNIDASRISVNQDDKNKRVNPSTSINAMFGSVMTRGETLTQGRFPSHLLLSHSEGCKYLGEKDVKRTAGGPSGVTPRVGVQGSGALYTLEGNNCPRITYQTNIDGSETIDNWQCEDDCPVKMLDEQSGVLKSGKHSEREKERKAKGMFAGGIATDENWYGDTGGASRFFYCAKVSSSERGDSKHPTMKSLKLMKYLITMVTPPNGIVLDPFMGSGSTGLACKELNFDFIGIEKEAEYFEIAKKRLGQCQI